MKILQQSANVLVPETPMKHIEKIGRICYKSEDKIADGTDKKFVERMFNSMHHAMLEHYRFIMEVSPMVYEPLMAVAHPHIGMTHRTYAGRDRFVISFNARALTNIVEDSHAADFGVLPMAIASIRDELIAHITRKYDCHELFGWNRNDIHMLSTGVEFIDNNPNEMSDDEWMIHGWMSGYMITDRGISHEIVRHREETSFAQESTRYCNYGNNKFGNEITVIDQGFEDHIRSKWECAMMYSEEMYFGLLKCGLTPQMARSVLPTCLKTEIVMTAPMYEWKHFFDLRMQSTTGAPHPMIQNLSTMLYGKMLEVYHYAYYEN